MSRGEKYKGVMNTLLMPWQHCSSECNSQTIWNTLDFKTTGYNDLSVIRISCPTLYSLSPLECCFDPAPHPPYWGSTCSLSVPEERTKRGWRLWHLSCSFLFSPWWTGMYLPLRCKEDGSELDFYVVMSKVGNAFQWSSVYSETL